jgi:hypothetical protein
MDIVQWNNHAILSQHRGNYSSLTERPDNPDHSGIQRPTTLLDASPDSVPRPPDCGNNQPVPENEQEEASEK